LSNLPAPPQADGARTRLIEIAAKVTDMECSGSRNHVAWLRAFRRNYRHMAVTFGLNFNYVDLSDALSATDEALDAKADKQAA
jgi:hypothetical protein